MISIVRRPGTAYPDSGEGFSPHESYPEYGFARHKGYATPEHLAALDRWGPCPLHRRTFSGVWRQGELFVLEKDD